MRLFLCSILAAFSLLHLVGDDAKKSLELLPEGLSHSEGIFLSDVVTNRTSKPLPRIRIAPAPVIGRPVVLTRYQITEVLKQEAPELISTNWIGSDRVRVARATRVFDEVILKEMLTQLLQDEIVKTRGELELRLNRAWSPVLVPDEPLKMRILDLPTSGIGTSFICRFELLTGEESIGNFQQPVQAKIWQEVYVSRSNILRGQLLRDADLGTEKRDLLTHRDVLTDIPLDDPYIEFRENVRAGDTISPRMLRLRAVVKRGKLVDALVQDETMTISVKAEALEDGVPGQVVRLRNIRSKREIRGKVQDEQTVLVMF